MLVSPCSSDELLSFLLQSGSTSTSVLVWNIIYTTWFLIMPVYKGLVNVYNSFTGWKVEKAHKSSDFSDWLEMADSNISTIVAFKYYASEVFKLKWNC